MTSAARNKTMRVRRALAGLCRNCPRPAAEERERQLTAALTAVAEERARCASVCREVAAFYDPPDVGSVVAHACADSIERESVSALLRSPGA